MFLGGLGDKNWSKALLRRVFYYNVSIHRITKFSPFELFYGRNPSLPIDSFLPITDRGENMTNFERLRTIEQNCVNHSSEVVEFETKLRFKFLETKDKFKVNDLVWYFKPSMAKLNRNWAGPYKISKIINESVVELSDQNGHSVRVLKYKLKQFVDRNDMLSTLPGGFQDLSDDDNNDEILILKGGYLLKILNHL